MTALEKLLKTIKSPSEILYQDGGCAAVFDESGGYFIYYQSKKLDEDPERKDDGLRAHAVGAGDTIGNLLNAISADEIDTKKSPALVAAFEAISAHRLAKGNPTR